MAGLINLRLLTDFFNKIGQQATSTAFSHCAALPNDFHTSATREFGRPLLYETADSFRRVLRGLQPALLLSQLSRGDVRPFEYGFPRIGEGRRDR
jgi:hypothetical protein